VDGEYSLEKNVVIHDIMIVPSILGWLPLLSSFFSNFDQMKTFSFSKIAVILHFYRTPEYNSPT